MIHNGHWTHPELWFMWISGLLTPVNTLAIIWLLVRRTGKMKELKLRGAAVLLAKAAYHVGNGHRINDWDGSYMDPAIERADCILRKALWDVEHELRQIRKPNAR